MILVNKDKITKGSLGGKKFQYNPTTYDRSNSATYNEVRSSGMSYPALSFGGGNLKTITFTLYLNDRTSSYGATKEYIKHLEKYLPNSKKTNYQFKPPKKIRFSYGWEVKDCYLTDMATNVLAMSNTLNPIEAEITVTLTPIK